MNADDAPASARVEREARLPASAAGTRVDQALAALWPDFSRSRLVAWLNSGELVVDGRTVKPRALVLGGERVALRAELLDQVASEPEAIALALLYTDRDVLVVDKPAGLVVHPGAGNRAGTLQNALLHHDATLAKLPRAGIVHRLDKDTSGAMVVARTLAAHTRLVEMLAAREVHRQYEAIVHGTLVAGATIDAPIGRHPRDRLRMAVVESGRHAVTHYRVRERFPAHTSLQVNLETGRTHQIRVHFAHERHPLLGDPQYGPGVKLPRGASPHLQEALRSFRRQALHAERLEFAHPRSGKPVAVEAPRPRDMEQLLAALRDDQGARA